MSKNQNVWWPSRPNNLTLLDGYLQGFAKNFCFRIENWRSISCFLPEYRCLYWILLVCLSWYIYRPDCPRKRLHLQFQWYSRKNLPYIFLHFHSNFESILLQMCEPFYGSNNVKILAYCLFYFIPTLVLMQCYGSIFHSKRMQAMRRATKQNGSTSKYGKSHKQTITLKYLFSVSPCLEY